MTTAWTAEHVRMIDRAQAPEIPLIHRPERGQLDPEKVYWDMWPIQSQEGHVARIGGRELWMALTAPDRGDPAMRHFEAKIHLLEQGPDGWRDLGPVLPDADVPYEREWAGSALFNANRITLYFTAAGHKSKRGGYQQQLWEASARVGENFLPVQWSTPRPSIDQYGPHYMPADAHEGEAGKIKAFRDPAFFRDPASGREYLIFTASSANSESAFNGAVGVATRDDGAWHLLPPLITAERVNNELERAHAVFHEGRYYVFWSTQRDTFSPDLRNAPNGLYGMVSDHLLGNYRPLNGSGLVLANPERHPHQTYSWFVDASLQVCSFIDYWGPGGDARSFPPAPENARFGGVPAPLLKLKVQGDCCGLMADTDSKKGITN